MNGQLLTFYDDATGERTGLTAAELGSWVSATARLLTAECGLRRGSRAGRRRTVAFHGAVFRVRRMATLGHRSSPIAASCSRTARSPGVSSSITTNPHRS
jgi:hypothetical protein